VRLDLYIMKSGVTTSTREWVWSNVARIEEPDRLVIKIKNTSTEDNILVKYTWQPMEVARHPLQIKNNISFSVLMSCVILKNRQCRNLEVQQNKFTALRMYFQTFIEAFSLP